MNDDLKHAWLDAYRDGLFTAFLISVGVNREMIVSQMQSFFPGTLTYAQTSSAVDRIYETPENGPIPIPFALRAIVMKMSGAGQAEIDDYIATGRQLKE